VPAARRRTRTSSSVSWRTMVATTSWKRSKPPRKYGRCSPTCQARLVSKKPGHHREDGLHVRPDHPASALSPESSSGTALESRHRPSRPRSERNGSGEHRVELDEPLYSVRFGVNRETAAERVRVSYSSLTPGENLRPRHGCPPARAPQAGGRPRRLPAAGLPQRTT
jgi:hypothetical protein